MDKGEKKMAKVMHEYKEGELKSSSGQKAKSREQAIAIGLSEKRKAMRGSPVMYRHARSA